MKREFLLVEGKDIQQTKFYSVFSIDVATGNDPMRQQREATITCCKCGKKGHYRKDSPNATGTSPIWDQTPTYSHPPPVTQTIIVSYAVPQTSVVAILKEVVKTKQSNWQLRKSIQQTLPKQTPPLAQPAVTKPTTTPKSSDK